jgi:hypothetical protein
VSVATLIVTVCLLGEPVRCEEEQVTMEGTAMMCLLNAQQEIARRFEDDPRPKAITWKCLDGQPT